MYTGDMGERETLENFILSEKTRKTHYLYGETATYIGSGKETKGSNMESKRKQVRTELHI